MNVTALQTMNLTQLELAVLVCMSVSFTIAEGQQFRFVFLLLF